MFFIDKYVPVKMEDHKITDVKTDDNVLRLNRVFFNQDILKKLEKISKDDSIPHIVFYGPEGSGKKTLIKLFLEMIYDSSVNKIVETKYNVSGSGNSVTEVGIKQSNFHIVIEPNNNNFDRYLIQDVVKEYAKRMPLNIFATKKVFKTVLINNVDKLSYYAQTSLRRTMEKYSGTCRFIMWCRSLSKVIDPLISRCLSFRIASPTDSEVLEYILKICYKEKINISFEKIQKIIETSDCNIKKILWRLELYKNGFDYETSYEETIKLICRYLLIGKVEAFLSIRDLLYRVMITNIDGTNIIRNIVEELIKTDTIDDVSKFKIIRNSAIQEHNLIQGRREIIHLEPFIQSTLKIIYHAKKLKRAEKKKKDKSLN
tara:strand:+ start:8307 stop:9422 length:1116 start_codon:yes stop_codon:yes gene_type:complete